MDIQQWVANATGDASGREIAAKIGWTASTVNRQLSKDAPDPELVVAIARKYSASVLDGLIAHGLIKPDELNSRVIVSSISDATDAELVAEIYRRLQEGSATGTDSVHDVTDLFPEQEPHAAERSDLPDDPDHP